MQQRYFLSLWCGDRREVWWRFQVSGPASPNTLLGTGTYKVPFRAVITAVIGTPNVTVSSETTSVTITNYSWMNAQNKRLKEGTGIWVLPVPRAVAISFWRKAEDFLTAVSGTQAPWLQWKSWDVSSLRRTQAAFTAQINKMNHLSVFQSEMYIILTFRRQKTPTINNWFSIYVLYMLNMYIY